MKNYVQGGSRITVTADREVSYGALYAVGALIGFAVTDATAGQDFAIVTDGVYAVSVAATDDISVGDVIYLDDQLLTADADDGEGVDFVRAGIVTAGGVAADGYAEVHLKINA